MAVALVSAGPMSQNSLTSIQPAFGTPTTAGNLLIAVCSSYETNVLSSPATTTPGWIRARTLNAIWYKPNCAAGETAPTFTDATATAMHACLAEFSGVATSTPLDQTAPGTSVNGGTETCDAPDSAANDLLIAAQMIATSKSGTCTWTASFTPTGGTSSQYAQDGATKGTSFLSVWYYLIAGNGGVTADSVVAQGTVSAGTPVGQCGIATFLSAAAPPAPSKPVYPVMARRRF